MKRLAALIIALLSLAWADSAAANISQTWANATAGQALNGYTEGGSAWTDSCGDWKFSTATPRRLYQITTYGGCTSTLAYTPPTPNYDVAVDFYHASTVSESSFDVRGRITGNAFYRATYSVDGGGYSLSRVTNGASKLLCSYTSTPAVGSTHNLMLRERGPTISMLVDGTVPTGCTATDNALTAAGAPGLGGGYLSYAATDTTGDQIVDFTETDASGLYATATAGLPGNGTASASAAATGGTTPYTHQWYHSATAGQQGTAISGATSATVTDTGQQNGVPDCLTDVMTDSTSGTPLISTSNQVCVTPMATVFGQTVQPGLYVSPTATNTTACTFAAPCPLASAITLATGTSTAALFHDSLGYIPIWLKGGFYPMTTHLLLGSASDTNLDIKSMYGQIAVFDGGGTADEAFYLNAASNLKFRHFWVQNFANYGFLINASTKITLDSLTISNIAGVSAPQAAVLYQSVDTGGLMTHNLIYNVQGFALAKNAPSSPSNYVTESFNVVHDICLNSPDCGGIYGGDQGYQQGGYGASTGDRFLFNAVWNVGPAGNNGSVDECLYADDGESNSVWYGNLCFGYHNISAIIHGGDHNTFLNNIFDLTNVHSTLLMYQGENTKGNLTGAGNVVTRNLVYANPAQLGACLGSVENCPSTVGYYSPTLSAQFGMVAPSMNGNAYSSAAMNIGTFPDLTPTISAPMNFRNAAANDYRFTTAGPPLAGFIPFDTSTWGPTDWGVPIDASVLAVRHVTSYTPPVPYTPPAAPLPCAAEEPVGGTMPVLCLDFADGVYTKQGVSYATPVAAGATQPSGCTITAAKGLSCASGAGLTIANQIPAGTPYSLAVTSTLTTSGEYAAALLNGSTAAVKDYQSAATTRSANGSTVAGTAGEDVISCPSAASSTGISSVLGTLGVSKACSTITAGGTLVVANQTATGTTPAASPDYVSSVRIYLLKRQMTALEAQTQAGR